jgi:hypothetical protein
VGTLVSVVLKRLKREADKAIEAAKIALSSAGATALRFSPLGLEVNREALGLRVDDQA